MLAFCNSYFHHNSRVLTSQHVYFMFETSNTKGMGQTSRLQAFAFVKDASTHQRVAEFVNGMDLTWSSTDVATKDVICLPSWMEVGSVCGMGLISKTTRLRSIIQNSHKTTQQHLRLRDNNLLHPSRLLQL